MHKKRKKEALTECFLRLLRLFAAILQSPLKSSNIFTALALPVNGQNLTTELREARGKNGQ
jgi:hypothetical protein